MQHNTYFTIEISLCNFKIDIKKERTNHNEKVLIEDRKPLLTSIN